MALKPRKKHNSSKTKTEIDRNVTEKIKRNKNSLIALSFAKSFAKS